MTDQSERRKQIRVKVRWPVAVLADHGTIKGKTTNITTEGVLVSCEEPLRINDTYRMSILPPDHDALGITGKIVWSDLYGIGEDDTAYGMGICLVELSDEDRQFLNDIVSTHLKEQKKKGAD